MLVRVTTAFDPSDALFDEHIAVFLNGQFIAQAPDPEFGNTLDFMDNIAHQLSLSLSQPVLEVVSTTVEDESLTAQDVDLSTLNAGISQFTEDCLREDECMPIEYEHNELVFDFESLHWLRTPEQQKAASDIMNALHEPA